MAGFLVNIQLMMTAVIIFEKVKISSIMTLAINLSFYSSIEKVFHENIYKFISLLKLSIVIR